MLARPVPRHFRTLFISDVHLGCKGCQAALLLDFLRYHDAESLYLIGDIVDGWSLKRGWYWPQEHNDVVQKLLRKGRKGSRIIYIPGNHDEFLRDYAGTHFGGVEVMERTLHETADGRRFLVIHGDSSTSSCVTPAGSPISAPAPTAAPWRSTPSSTARAVASASTTGRCRRG